MEVSFEYTIAPASDLIHKIENTAKELFSHVSGEIKEQTFMVLRELLENAVKYGEVRPSIENIKVKFKANENKILIEVSNAVIMKDHISQFKDHIKMIQEADDLEALYTNRLKELMENAIVGESRLGLYRIAYEGMFELSYKYENSLLTVIAERKLK